MSDHHTIAERVGTGPSRRTFLGYVIAGATLVTGAEMGLGTESAEAVVPTPPQPAEILDLNDLLTLAAAPTAALITVTIGTAALRSACPSTTFT